MIINPMWFYWMSVLASEKTTTKMLIASQVNETNVERAKEVVDYIIDKINEAGKEKYQRS